MTGGLGGSGRAGVVAHLAVARERRWEAAGLRVSIGDGERPTMRDVSGPCSVSKNCQKSRKMKIRNTHCGRGGQAAGVVAQTLAVASEGVGNEGRRAR